MNSWQIEIPIDFIEIYTYEDVYSVYDSYGFYYDQLQELDKAREKLTDYQGKIVDMLLDGYKQEDIAKSLGIGQSAISLAINGVPNYKYGNKRMGGILRKLRKHFNVKTCKYCTNIIKQKHTVCCECKRKGIGI